MVKAAKNNSLTRRVVGEGEKVRRWKFDRKQTNKKQFFQDALCIDFI